MPGHAITLLRNQVTWTLDFKVFTTGTSTSMLRTRGLSSSCQSHIASSNTAPPRLGGLQQEKVKVKVKVKWTLPQI